MIILGLGSNLGDREAHLRKGLNAIKAIPGLIIEKISPVYLSDALLPENGSQNWDLPYFNAAIRCSFVPGQTLEPLELLDKLKAIEYALGRKPKSEVWSPRPLDIDLLVWDDQIIHSERLTVPHANILERPFVIFPLADVAPFWRFPLPGACYGKSASELAEQWPSRFDGNAPLHTRQIYQRIDTPMLVGIINVTPDSFSDGGKFSAPELAVEQALYLAESGASMLDIGAESTAPHALPLTAEQEWLRLEPVLKAIASLRVNTYLPVKLSIDSRHAVVIEKALAIEPSLTINDVTGGLDPTMRAIVAETGLDFVMMHSLSIPASREQVIEREENIVDYLHEWALRQIESLTQSGINSAQIIFDPGIGFGKIREHSLELLRQIDVFADLGVRILVGHSRKSYLSLMTPYLAAERDIETVAQSIAFLDKSIDYLRVHDVLTHARAFRAFRTLE